MEYMEVLYMTTSSDSARSGGSHHKVQAGGYHYHSSHVLIWGFLVAEVPVGVVIALLHVWCFGGWLV